MRETAVVALEAGIREETNNPTVIFRRILTKARLV